MAILDTIEAGLRDSLRSDGGLIFSNSNAGTQNLIDWVTTLPGESMVLEAAAVTRADSTLTLQGCIVGVWAIRGLTDVQLTELRVTVTYRDDSGSIGDALDVAGVLRALSLEFAMAGNLQADGSLAFGLTAGSQPVTAWDSMLGFLSDGWVTSTLLSNNPLFVSTPIATLTARFSFAGDAPTLLTASARIDGSWEVVPGLIEIADAAPAASATWTPIDPTTFSLALASSVTGSITVGSTAYLVTVGVNRDLIYDVRFSASAGGLLPSLPELAEYVGGKSLANSVQAGLDALHLDEIAIDSVEFSFDASTLELTTFVMDSHITVAGVRIDLYTRLPEFAFGGAMAEGESISLETLAQDYFSSSANFPETDITELAYTAAPEDGCYTFTVTLETDWEIALGQASLALKKTDLDLAWSNGFSSGSLSTTLEIASVEIVVLAQSPTEPGEGWQFTGETGPGQAIPIGKLIDDLVSLFGPVALPASLQDLTLSNLSVTFNTETLYFTFSCDLAFPIGGQDVAMKVDIRCEPVTGGYAVAFGGAIIIGDLPFQLYFASDPTQNAFVAAYAKDETVKMATLVAGVSPELAAIVPDSLSLTLKQALFGYLKQASQPSGSYLFTISLETGLNLSDISPLLGQALPSDESLGVDDLQVYVTSGALAREQVDALNTVIGELNALALVEDAVTELPPRALESGFSYAYTLKLGGQSYLFGLPIAEAPAATEAAAPASTATPPSTSAAAPSSTSTATTSTATTSTAAPAAEEPDQSKLSLVTEGSSYTLWYDLQLAFGPVEFDRLGLRYTSDKSELWFVLDATLKSTSVELSLEGLAFGSRLDRFAPVFDLAGIGLGYESGTVALTGQLLHNRTTGDYEGGVILKTKTFSLAAMASYGKVGGHPSLFIYGILTKPIGGPAFFFVEALSAGLGYNRALRTPSIEQIPDFPLVSEAIDPSTSTGDLNQELEKLQDYLTPSLGAQFYAFGVKFNTFKVVDSFALFIALIDGKAWKIKLLGYSVLTVPFPTPGKTVTDPLAYIELALDGTIDPADGLMGIQGQLTTNSYVFCRDCEVTGGFAFFAWFSGKHEGDFVQTIGGYHPDFDVPDHYPTVPRLGLRWRVDSHFSVEGELYFALTPRALMAGGYMKAVWKESGIDATFKARADFLVSWKPYYYSLSIKIDVSVSAKIKVKLGFATIHKKITVSVGAQIDLWGPKFAGKAKIKCSVISFTIAFGGGKPKADPIDWAEFREAFLPANDVCSLTALDGLQSTFTDANSQENWLMLGKPLCVLIDSAIPANSAEFSYENDAGQLVTDVFVATSAAGTSAASGQEIALSVPTFGLGPMGVSASATIVSRLVVAITREGRPVRTTDFKLTPYRKSLPAGSWGTEFKSKLNDSRTIPDAWTGFTIEPGAKVAPYSSTSIPSEDLEVNPDPLDAVYAWDGVSLASVESSWSEEQRLAAIASGDTAFQTHAAALVGAIFADLEPVAMSAFDASLYRETPQIEQTT